MHPGVGIEPNPEGPAEQETVPGAPDESVLGALTALQARGTDAAGNVRVTLDGRGRLVDLELTDVSVTEICLLVGFTSLGTFSRTFREVVGRSPSEYRGATPPHPPVVPGCFSRSWTRPGSRTAVSEKPPPGAAP